MSLVSSVEAPAQVTDAIRKASRATGTNFDYLLKTAARESSFKTNARARTSSATGLFQFIETTWLKTVKEEGHRFGLGDYSADIEQAPTGRYHVPDPDRRREILALRKDPEVSAMMAGAFTRQNADYVSTRLGRDATHGELYMAHFLGPRGAARFIELTDRNPDAPADKHFPKAARANRAIFYQGGRPRTLAQVYDKLVSTHRTAKSDTAKTGDPAPQTPSAAPVLTEVATPVRKVKVAALAAGTLRVGSGTLSDVGLGSIGGWQPIVRAELASVSPPSAEGTPQDPAPAGSSPMPEPNAPTLRARPAPAPSMPASPPGEAARSPLRLSSSAFELFQEEFWQRLSMDGS